MHLLGLDRYFLVGYLDSSVAVEIFLLQEAAPNCCSRTFSACFPGSVGGLGARVEKCCLEGPLRVCGYIYICVCIYLHVYMHKCDYSCITAHMVFAFRNRSRSHSAGCTLHVVYGYLDALMRPGYGGSGGELLDSFVYFPSPPSTQPVGP